MTINCSCSEHNGTHWDDELIIALDDLVEALKDKTVGINTKEADGIVERFAAALAGWFMRISDEYPWDRLESLLRELSKPIEAEQSLDVVDDWLRYVLELNVADLEKIILTYMKEGYQIAANQTLASLEVHNFAVLDEGALKWIESHGAELVKDINDVTPDMLGIRNIIDKGVAEGQPVQKMAREIKAQFSEMADQYKGRAFVIAQTETANAMSEASLQTYMRLGVEGKGWNAALEPCDICIRNQSVGVIPVDQAFPSGDMRPAAHPRCKCSLYPASLPRGKE